MKTILHSLTIILIVCVTNSYAQTTAIPDSNFEQALIDLGHDSGTPDGSILTATANAVTGTLDIRSKNISDLSGIQAFTSIISLNIKTNSITSLDLSALTQLEVLEAAGNGMTSINVNGLTNLRLLIVQQNALTSIDLTGLSGLDYLYLGENQLTSVDVSDSPNIRRFYLNQNPNLGNFTFNNVAGLERFRFNGTGLTSLNIDLVNHPNLDHVYAYDCPNLTTIDITNSGSATPVLKTVRFFNTAVASLDLSNVTSLTQVQIQDNANLTEVNIKNGNNTAITTANLKAANCPNLGCVKVDDATYSTTNWTDIAASSSVEYYTTTCTLGIDEVKQLKVSVYPNPVSGTQIFVSSKEALTYSIHNMISQKVKEGRLSSGKSSINISTLSNSLHFISLKTDGGDKKIIKFYKK